MPSLQSVQLSANGGHKCTATDAARRASRDANTVAAISELLLGRAMLAKVHFDVVTPQVALHIFCKFRWMAATKRGDGFPALQLCRRALAIEPHIHRDKGVLP